MSVREIERRSTESGTILAIRKVERKDAATFYVVVKLEGSKEIVQKTGILMLAEARKEAGIAYAPPLRETKAKAQYPQYTGGRAK